MKTELKFKQNNHMSTGLFQSAQTYVWKLNLNLRNI